MAIGSTAPCYTAPAGPPQWKSETLCHLRCLYILIIIPSPPLSQQQQQQQQLAVRSFRRSSRRGQLVAFDLPSRGARGRCRSFEPVNFAPSPLFSRDHLLRICTDEAGIAGLEVGRTLLLCCIGTDTRLRREEAQGRRERALHEHCVVKPSTATTALPDQQQY